MIPRFAPCTRLLAVGAIVVAALGLTACTDGDSVTSSADVNTVDPALASGIDDAIASAMQQSGSTEAVVGVWGSDGSEYLRGYGDSGVDGSASIRGAQATQPVMCALMLDLVDEGTIDLDGKVSEDLTRQSGIEDVTYRQLCEMRSGIADYKSGFADIFANNPTRPWAEQELLAEGLSRSPESWPGLDFHQSDSNMVLLARALKVKTGQELPDLLRDHVFSDVNMGSTYFPAPNSTTISGDALQGLTYPSSGGKAVCDAAPVEVSEVSPSMLAGAGATVTTVTDLKNFYDGYLGGTFGGESAGIVTETFPTKNPERDENGEPTSEVAMDGRLWSFGVEKEGPLFGRGGSITGTLTAAYTDPESGFSVVVALNNSSAGIGFVKALAFQLASLSQSQGVAPELTWTLDQQTAALAKAAVCQ
ncbi:beta-lactamase family protein [Leucobacter sp. Marseille-Q4368]|uniref:Beta-lactamase family protein n=1 Tax=Leucobacter manosquensis TaxID=2810611 RepID=A0ABS5M700_9MICO|nr:serine hydrolase domain-containing protein [Leucobacter manosquensis]MBS3182968.1 beta-lactamase family protein [Leucobacter manosquensis]